MSLPPWGRCRARKGVTERAFLSHPHLEYHRERRYPIAFSAHCMGSRPMEG